jgi:hypothetical protein
MTRERIVRAAAELMHASGMAGTTLDQVIEASGMSKSQLYHYGPGVGRNAAPLTGLSGCTARGTPTLTDTSTAMGLWFLSDSGFPVGRIGMRFEDRAHASAQRRDGLLGEPRVAGLPAEVQW